MGYFTGIDVSLEVSHFCVVDAAGEVAMEARARGAWAILGCFSGRRLDMEAIGLEAGPLSQWPYSAMIEPDLPAVLLETARFAMPSVRCR